MDHVRIRFGAFPLILCGPVVCCPIMINGSLSQRGGKISSARFETGVAGGARRTCRRMVVCWSGVMNSSEERT